MFQVMEIFGLKKEMYLLTKARVIGRVMYIERIDTKTNGTEYTVQKEIIPMLSTCF